MHEKFELLKKLLSVLIVVFVFKCTNLCHVMLWVPVLTTVTNLTSHSIHVIEVGRHMEGSRFFHK